MDKQYSGVSEYTLNLVWALLKKNQEEGSPHKFVFYYNSARDIKHRIPDFKPFNPEFKYTRIPNKILNYFLLKPFNYPCLDKLMKVDIVLFPHINFYAVSPEAKTVLTIHDLSFLRYKNHFSLRKNIWHKLLNVSKLAQKADKIITISQNSKNDISELLGVAKEKIRVVKSGIDKKRYCQVDPGDPKIPEIKNKYKLPENFILYLGTLEPRKNLEGIIKAFDIFCSRFPKSDYNLVIAGGRGWKEGEVLRAWQESLNQEKIKFLGYIETEDKTYLYNLASLFAFPSLYEGFGLPPLEAMACGTPVVTSFTSSLPEVVADSAIKVNPYDYNQIASALEEGLFDLDLRKDLIFQGKERVRQFSWDRVAQDYFQTINELK